MSVHKSLKLKGSLQRSRNVLKREERIELMKERGQWKGEQSIYGLPKTRVSFAKKT
jgi:small basic protein (TIGR04137 family)